MISLDQPGKFSLASSTVYRSIPEDVPLRIVESDSFKRSSVIWWARDVNFSIGNTLAFAAIFSNFVDIVAFNLSLNKEAIFR